MGRPARPGTSPVVDLGPHHAELRPVADGHEPTAIAPVLLARADRRGGFGGRPTTNVPPCVSSWCSIRSSLMRRWLWGPTRRRFSDPPRRWPSCPAEPPGSSAVATSRLGEPGWPSTSTVWWPASRTARRPAGVTRPSAGLRGELPLWLAGHQHAATAAEGFFARSPVVLQPVLAVGRGSRRPVLAHHDR